MNNFSETFVKIKEDLIKTCENVVKNWLDGKEYNTEDAQIWANKIPEEIIKVLKSDYEKLKFICTSTIFQKRRTCLHFSSTCLWDNKTDGTISVKWENEKMYCLFLLFCVK